MTAFLAAPTIPSSLPNGPQDIHYRRDPPGGLRGGAPFLYEKACRPVEIDVSFGREVPDRLDGFVTDAAGRRIDDSSKAYRVVRHDGRAQVGHGVFDFHPVIKPHTADDLVPHALPDKLILKGARLGVRAEEYGKIRRPVFVAGHEVLYRPDDVARLLVLVACLKEDELFPLLVVGPEPFLLSPDVVSHHRAGRPQDILGRAVVFPEHDHRRLGEIALELKDIAEVGPPPPVNRLVVVPHDAEVFPAAP